MALLPDGSEHPPNERDNDLSANLSLIMQIMSRTGSPSQLLTLLRRRLGASVWVRPWAVAAVVSVCFGLAVLTYMQQAAERHEFRQALFATAHRVALAWDYHSYPHDLAVECRLLKPAVRTKEEEGVLSLFLAAWDIQSCSAFLTGLEEESRLNASILQSMKEDQERRGFENALNDAKRLIGTPGEVISPYRAVVDLSSLPNYADFEEQSEMLRKGYVRVAAAETSEPGILEPLKDLPRLEGKFGKYVEYESAKDYLAKLLVATTHTIGILINNRGRLP